MAMTGSIGSSRPMKNVMASSPNSVTATEPACRNAATSQPAAPFGRAICYFVAVR